jgi:integrase/recombinase XerD
MGIFKRGETFYGTVHHCGRRYRASLHTNKASEAKARFRVWEARIVDASFGLERHTWPEAVVRWVREVMPALRPGTQHRYLSSLKQVDPVLRLLFLDQIGKRELAAIVARPGVSNATRRRDLSAVRAVLVAAEAWGWLEEAPSARPALRLAPERRDPIVLPTDAEIERFVAACPPTLAALVRVLRLTGMRLEEAGGLRWINVDSNGINLGHTKTWRHRVLPITPELAAVLEALPRTSEFVFPTKSGTRRKGLAQALMKLRKAADIGFRTHDLRHRYAVDYLRAGGSIYDLKLLLGHETVLTTEGYLQYVAAPKAATG